MTTTFKIGCSLSEAPEWWYNFVQAENPKGYEGTTDGAFAEFGRLEEKLMRFERNYSKYPRRPVTVLYAHFKSEEHVTQFMLTYGVSR